MIIPWNTDAPLYHGPWATIGLIFVNVSIFIGSWVYEANVAPDDDAAVQADGEQPLVFELFKKVVIVYGDGLNPLAWFTSCFVHLSLMHLIGNMVYLWALGLIIEGKVGWWRFLLIYAGIGVIEGAVDEIGCAILGVNVGGSFGASAIIFGLVGMAFVWAPRNDLNCWVVVGWWVIDFDLPLMAFAPFYILWEGFSLFLLWALIGPGVTGWLLHMTGVVLGFMLGFVMLKLDWVDCENWDIIAVYQNREGKAAKRKRKEGEKPATTLDPALAQAQIKEWIAARNVKGAFALAERLAAAAPGWQLSREDHLAAIRVLQSRNEWEESIDVMVSFVRAWPGDSERVRLKLAEVLLLQGKRPAQALRVLSKLPQGPLPGSLEPTRKKLTAAAYKMREEGAVELETEDW
jgi:membrane associated rhomboid family serine protease